MDDSVEISREDLTDIAHTIDELLMFLDDIPKMIQEDRDTEVGFYSGEHAVQLKQLLTTIESNYDVKSMNEEKFFESLEEQFLNG
jgi:hypothetical protein